LAKLKRIPVIIWYPDVFVGRWISNVGLISGIMGELVERIVLRLPWDKIIALSQQTKKKLIQAGVPSSKIEVIYGGADLSLIRSIKAKKYSFPTVCCIARLVGYKRVQDLIQAIYLVKQKLPSVQLIIIGTGPQERKLKTLVKRLNLEKQVNFKNNLPYKEVIRILKKSHIFSLPSLVEGFGLVTIETCASGVPYVSADLPITREITHQGKGGLLFQPKDSRDLARKIIRLLTDKKLYKQKIKEGKKLAELYDWSTIAQKTEKVYYQVIQKQPE
jgi:glycosyltransferase involved in cell wall biosynthesis